MDAFVNLVTPESYARIVVQQIHMVRTAKPPVNAVTAVNAITLTAHVNVRLVLVEISVKTVVRRDTGASHHVRKDASVAQAADDVIKNSAHVIVKRVDMERIVSINVQDFHMDLDVLIDVNVINIDHVVATKSPDTVFVILGLWANNVMTDVQQVHMGGNVEINAVVHQVSPAIPKQVDVPKNVPQAERDIVVLSIAMLLHMVKIANLNVFVVKMHLIAMYEAENVNVNPVGLVINAIKIALKENMDIIVQKNVNVLMENALMTQENVFVPPDIPEQHVNSNVRQIDGAKIVHHFVSVVLGNATLLMEHAIVHRDILVEIVKKHVLWVRME